MLISKLLQAAASGSTPSSGCPSYTPPTGNNLQHDFTTSYTPPAGNNVQLDFCVSQ